MKPGNYVDPAYDLPKSWRDDYRYDEAGHLLGWTRSRGEKKEEFSAQGLVSEKTDELGRCRVGRTVRYVAQQPKPNKPPILVQELGDARITIAYGGGDDFSGRIEKAEKIQPAE
jgi:YD repeat-containing protein